MTKPVTVTVQDASASLLAGVKVYAYNGATYAGKTVTTDTNGQAVFTLPEGNYRFRADYGGLRYWSETANHCTVPGCTGLNMTVGHQPAPTPQANQPQGSTMVHSTARQKVFTLARHLLDSPRPSGYQTPQPSVSTITIDYTYDPLNRLTRAAYSDGRIYEYEYDAVGNWTKQTITINGQSSVINYQYDNANRLTGVNGVAYTYDDNGNLLSDGTNSYTYDSANRLKTVTNNQGAVTSYQYNGLGDRLKETVNGVTTTFTMDLNTSLTQVLSDGTYNYLYGNGRIAQAHLISSPQGATDTSTPEYFLTDALGSVRQLTDATGAVTLAKAYDPYGVVSMANGTSSSSYGYTGEQQDSSGMVYLRARVYDPNVGRFLTRDTWGGNSNKPLSYNRWTYVEGNPINLTDPTGMHPGYHSQYCDPLIGSDRLACEKIVRGISPHAHVTPSQLRYYDACTMGYGNNCDCEDINLILRIHKLASGSLHKKLEHRLSSDMANEYGWWWYYLLNSAPGFWNNQGKGHTAFSIALAFALGAELGNDDQYEGLGNMMAEASARKGWGEGFFRLIGGRQSVQMRINDVLYSGDWYRITDKNFASLLAEFAEVLQRDFNEYKMNDKAFPLAYKILTTAAWREGVRGNTPYEWGNPTLSSPSKLLEKLGSFSNKHNRSDGIYWFSNEWKKGFPTTIYNGIVMYQLAFVITQEQIAETCNNGSCVQP